MNSLSILNPIIIAKGVSVTCCLLATLFCLLLTTDAILIAAMDTPQQPLQTEMPLSGQDTVPPFVTSSTSSTGHHPVYFIITENSPA